MFGAFVRSYVLRRVTRSTRKAYAQGSRMWVRGTVMQGKKNCLGGEIYEWELTDNLTEFIAYSCVKTKNKESTVAGS